MATIKGDDDDDGLNRYPCAGDCRNNCTTFKAGTCGVNCTSYTSWYLNTYTCDDDPVVVSNSTYVDDNDLRGSRTRPHFFALTIIVGVGLVANCLGVVLGAWEGFGVCSGAQKDGNAGDEESPHTGTSMVPVIASQPVAPVVEMAPLPVPVVSDKEVVDTL